MINLKNQKGISIVVLTITIVVMLVLTGIIMGNSKEQLAMKNVNNLYSDIESIYEKVSDYYLKNNSLPTFENAYCNKNQLTTLTGGKINANDTDSYYVINLSNLDNLTLNYGREYKKWNNTSSQLEYRDLYIINETTHQIYYPKGITYDNTTYFSKEINAEEIDKITPAAITEDISVECTASKNIISSEPDKAIVTAEVTLNNLSSNFKKETLQYAFGTADSQQSTLKYTNCEVSSSNMATLVSKKLNNQGTYYLYIKILDKNGTEHIVTQTCNT